MLRQIENAIEDGINDGDEPRDIAKAVVRAMLREDDIYVLGAGETGDTFYDGWKFALEEILRG